MKVLKIQKDKSEALLFRMLPYSVVRELRKCRESDNLYVGSYQSATVLFADLADFQVGETLLQQPVTVSVLCKPQQFN